MLLSADLPDAMQHALEDRIASESRGLKRDVRRTQKKQEQVHYPLPLPKCSLPDLFSLSLLNEEQARLESFRPSRKAHEQDEAREVAERVSLNFPTYMLLLTRSVPRSVSSSCIH